MKKAVSIEYISIFIKNIKQSFSRNGHFLKRYGALFIFLAAFVTMTAMFPFSKVLFWPVSTVVTDRNGVFMYGELSSCEEWSLPVPIDDMGRWMPVVAVALEDKRFYTHNGVDAMALVRALWQNSKADKTVSGGSTITSQVIRISIDRKRTYANKILEFYQAMQLEQILSKRGILELYLNRASFGGNIRGVEAASLAWFNKSARDMSLAESVLLAGILRGPSFYRPDRHPKRAKELRDRLLDILAEQGTVTKEEAQRAKNEPLPKEKLPIPSLYRQASQQVIKNCGTFDIRDRFGRIRSTIDTNIEQMLLSELSKAIKIFPSTVTAAAVMLENNSGAVAGYIGNVREGTECDASWVDCADSYRSPGSALKPFIYALAFDLGRITPETMLEDSPLSMQGYAPRNFDRHYRGPVSVRAALADSLNVPAVRILRRVSGRRVINLYRHLGFENFKKDADWYGDSIALGGCEVTPLELAMAYRLLTQNGFSSNLTWLYEGKSERKARVLSHAACFLTLDILKDTDRLSALYREVLGNDDMKIAFKTGTSYGMRDSWTAAVTKKYTLVIWIGDPSGKPHMQMAGARAAAPAAIRIMRRLTAGDTGWFEKPSSVKKRGVCALSGLPRNRFCPNEITDFYIDGVSTVESCHLHVMEDGKLLIKWPPELEGFFSGASGSSFAAHEIAIVSPKNGAVYILDKEHTKLPLAAEGGQNTLYWFIDGEMLTSSDRSTPSFWKLQKGTHVVSVSDEEGSTASCTIKVKDKEEDEELLPLLLEAD